MKAGILIDTWKLPIFEKHLKEENIPYTPAASSAQASLPGSSRPKSRSVSAPCLKPRTPKLH